MANGIVWMKWIGKFSEFQPWVESLNVAIETDKTIFANIFGLSVEWRNCLIEKSVVRIVEPNE